MARATRPARIFYGESSRCTDDDNVDTYALCSMYIDSYEKDVMPPNLKELVGPWN